MRVILQSDQKSKQTTKMRTCQFGQKHYTYGWKNLDRCWTRFSVVWQDWGDVGVDEKVILKCSREYVIKHATSMIPGRFLEIDYVVNINTLEQQSDVNILDINDIGNVNHLT